MPIDTTPDEQELMQSITQGLKDFEQRLFADLEKHRISLDRRLTAAEERVAKATKRTA